MNIFFLTLVFPESESDRNLYSDLIDELSASGHEVTIFRPNESVLLGKARESIRNGVKIVSIPTGRITKTSRLVKMANTLSLEGKYFSEAKKRMTGKVDLVLYSTPPITFIGAVEKIKRLTGARSYLLLKDIFPQNAVDIGMMSPFGLPARYFRHMERRLYAASDRIGCMSKANVEYLLTRNPWIERGRVHVCPNSIRPTAPVDLPMKKEGLVGEYGMDDRALKLVYGGNLGKPQGVDFVVEAISALEQIENVEMIIVGDGTEFGIVEKYVEKNGIKHSKFIGALPKAKYLELLANVDAGLLFLDRRFTIPNFPSRILDYMDCSLPIIAATDGVTDIRQEVCEAGAGLWSEAGNLDAFVKNVLTLRDNPELRITMGKRARRILEESYDVKLAARRILEAVKQA